MTGLFSPITTLVSFSEDEYRAYLGKNADFYLRAWSGDGKRMHLPAFLIGGLWLGYRKLYFACGLLGIVVAIDFTFCEVLLSTNMASERMIELWTRSSVVLYAAIIAAFSHRAVLYRANKVIERGHARHLDPAGRLSYITSKGQVSVLHAILGVLYMIGVGAMISLLVFLAVGLI